MNDILLIARLLLAVVFALAGVAKLLDPSGSRRSLEEFGLPAFLARPLAFLLPAVELTCAVALIPVTSAWWGASGALAMLLLFMAVIAISLARGRRPDCHCFGQLHASAVSGTTLLRNGILAGLAALIVWQGPAKAGGGLGDRLASLSWSESLVLALAITLAGLTALGLAALYFVLRQNGRVLLRLQAIEAKLGLGADQSSSGLPVESVAPSFRGKALAGETVTLEMLRARGKPLLLVFSETDCDACDEALPEFAQWQREHADRLLIVPITRGGVHVNRAKSRKHRLQNVLLQADREIAEAYRVERTPSAVLVNEGRIESSLAEGVDAIRALVVNATSPQPLRKGDLVATLRLQDLSGRTVDLAQLRGRRTLLMFWDPSCGFCQSVLEDVKAWERIRPEDSPELVVISTGSSEANRRQGFRSRVLLDAHFGAGQTFGADGTPSAIVLDEEGRVASDVGVGAAAVLALAGAIPAGSALSA